MVRIENKKDITFESNIFLGMKKSLVKQGFVI